MSTTAPRELFAGWIDDAAVFPPGNSPLGDAWREHRALRLGPYADLLGPLLIPTSAAREVVALGGAVNAAAHSTSTTAPLEVSVIARAGIPAAELLEAVSLVRSSDAARVVGAECVHDGADTDDLQRVLDLGVATAVELPRDAAPSTMFALADLAEHSPGPVIAKLRTQATRQAPPPSAGQLATFLLNAHRVGLPVKLTGGLHRALRHGYGRQAEHGCLNVLVAVASVREGGDGADHDFVVDVLEQRHPSPLLAATRSWTGRQISAVREAFPSFGCCGVLDPISDLAGLGLVPADLTEEIDAPA